MVAMFPVGSSLAVRATRTIARSALPDAPVVAGTGARPHRVRTAVAALLRYVAGRAAERVDRPHLRPRDLR